MKCTTSQIYFGKELHTFRTDLLSIIRSLNTVYTATEFVMLVMLTASEATMKHLHIVMIKNKFSVNNVRPNHVVFLMEKLCIFCAAETEILCMNWMKV